MKVFDPFSTYSSPSLTAEVLIDCSPFNDGSLVSNSFTYGSITFTNPSNNRMLLLLDSNMTYLNHLFLYSGNSPVFSSQLKWVNDKIHYF